MPEADITTLPLHLLLRLKRGENCSEAACSLHDDRTVLKRFILLRVRPLRIALIHVRFTQSILLRPEQKAEPVDDHPHFARRVESAFLRIATAVIMEAACRQSMNFVPVKSIEQQDIQAIHRVRELLICRPSFTALPTCRCAQTSARPRDGPDLIKNAALKPLP
uniref:Uncharacterized protein n=1 Tax=Ralstonia solanacearum TaxID=305 RepID=A0A0S4TUK8_RALSL|nr:protein of unknown function [Ralstonia solanacearum]